MYELCTIYFKKAKGIKNKLNKLCLDANNFKYFLKHARKAMPYLTLIF